MTTIQKWKESEREVDHITDGKGKKVDDDIKEIVVALRVLDFPTTGSCEGHINWGFPYPWVEISEAQPVDFLTNDQAKQEWKEKNLRQQSRLFGLLEAFYLKHTTSFDAQLIFNTSGFDRFRLQSRGGDITRLLPEEERKHRLLRYQKEMSAFAEYLKRQHLS